MKAKLALALNKNSPADQDSRMAKTAADAAARLPERLRDPAVFLAELPALVTTVAGLAVVVDGARCHPAHPRVQAAVLVALTPLIRGAGDKVKANGQTVDSNIGKLFELGALEAALAAMSAHAAERAVQAAAWGMLASLMNGPHDNGPHDTAICTKFAELGGIARVMGALDAFPRDRELVRDAVDVLKCLMIAGDTARTAQIIALGGMERVLVAMDNHPDGGVGVCHQAVFAMEQMSQAGPEAEQRLAALGAAARVRAAMAAPDVYKYTTYGWCGQKLLARLAVASSAASATGMPATMRITAGTSACASAAWASCAGTASSAIFSCPSTTCSAPALSAGAGTGIRAYAARTPLRTENIRTLFDVLPPYLTNVWFFPRDAAPAPCESTNKPRESSTARGAAAGSQRSGNAETDRKVRIMCVGAG